MPSTRVLIVSTASRVKLETPPDDSLPPPRIIGASGLVGRYITDAAGLVEGCQRPLGCQLIELRASGDQILCRSFDRVALLQLVKEEWGEAPKAEATPVKMEEKEDCSDFGTRACGDEWGIRAVALKVDITQREGIESADFSADPMGGFIIVAAQEPSTRSSQGIGRLCVFDRGGGEECGGVYGYKGGRSF
eukprot:GHVO01027464.1.p2 GENE.GHVO01027464.1~~GHVO01027464.1.p2  ORF type:complete len:191 (+),score=47.06 GHVO01027464.1:999-1571(+)